MRKQTIAACAVLGTCASIGAPGHGHPAHSPRTVMAILAHPDDELVIAPALAREAREGGRVIIVYATDGDAGPGVSGIEPGEKLAQARRAEAYCAAQALGALPVYLQFGDGTLAETPRRKDSAANQLRARIGQEITDRRPDIVITWGPDGGYGHADHRMISALVTQTLQERPPEMRPELFYPAMVHAPLPERLKAQGWAATSADLADVRYTYTDADLAAANTATLCHKTQFDEDTRAILTPAFHADIWKGDVAFRSAF